MKYLRLGFAYLLVMFSLILMAHQQIHPKELHLPYYLMSAPGLVGIVCLYPRQVSLIYKTFLKRDVK